MIRYNSIVMSSVEQPATASFVYGLVYKIYDLRLSTIIIIVVYVIIEVRLGKVTIFLLVKLNLQEKGRDVIHFY